MQPSLHHQSAGFTLIEVLAAGLLIIIVGVFGYTAYFTVTKVGRFNESQIKAVNFSQKCLEAAKAQAYLNFDTFSTEVMTDPVSGVLVRDQNINSKEFEGYSASMSVSVDPNAQQVKQINLTVSWEYEGKPHSLKYSFLVTRPPANLPGDIEGTVTDQKSGKPIIGAFVGVLNVNNPNLRFTTTTDNKGHFSFQDKITQAFILQPGEWWIGAEQQNYVPYRAPKPIQVFSGQQTTFNIEMVPNPKPAQIIVDVLDQDTGEHINTFTALAQDCNPAQSTPAWSYSSPQTYTVPFDISEVGKRKCFTVLTSFVGGGCNKYSNHDDFPYDLARGPRDTNQNHLGYSQNACEPSQNEFGKSYDYRGWSSARWTDNGLKCNNYFWNGGASDSVCVSAGEVKHVYPKLVKNPTATLFGRLTYNNQTTPETEGSVTVFWGPASPGSTKSQAGMAYTSFVNSTTGKYEVTIPAAQELFPDKPEYWLGVQACGLAWDESVTPKVKKMVCSPAYVKYPTIYPNNVSQHMDIGEGAYAGKRIEMNIEIDDVVPVYPGPPPWLCWSVVGQVVDAYTMQPLAGAKVSLPDYKASGVTDAAGKADLGCLVLCTFDEHNNIDPACQKAPPIGRMDVVKKNDSGEHVYYPYSNTQNIWYVAQKKVIPWNASAEDNTGFTLPTIRLIPAQKGDIIVNLVNSSGYPLANFPVKMTNIDDSTVTLTSNANGQVVFKNVWFSWPSADFTTGTSSQADASQYYNSKVRKISIQVLPPDNLYLVGGPSDITLTNADLPSKTITIVVAKKPGV